MDSVVLDYLGALTEGFVDPKKRVFAGYLAAALAIACLAMLGTAGWNLRAGAAAGRRLLFSRAIWWSPSARADYKMLAINRALMMALGPRLAGRMALASALFAGLHAALGGRPEALALPGWLAVLGFTLSHFLLDDLSKYLVHRALHRWPLLWAFHKVHHSATTLTPLTVYRTHPLEAVLFSLRGTTVQAGAVALFVFFFGSAVDLFTVLGANVLLFAFNATGANLRHSHVRIGYGRRVERILMSPAQHQIHHSVEERHRDRNFGTVLALWDWLGGTLCLAEKGDDLRYGLGPGAAAGANSLSALYARPVAEAAGVLYSAAARAGRLAAATFFARSGAAVAPAVVRPAPSSGGFAAAASSSSSQPRKNRISGRSLAALDVRSQ